MRHRLLMAIGYSLVALCSVGIGVRVVAALLNGRPTVGTNVYGLPIWTYSTAAVLIIVVIALVASGAGRIRNALRRRAEK